MTIDIRSAKVREKLFLDFMYEQLAGTIKNEVNISSDAPIHPDLAACFSQLIPHLALITEQLADGDELAEAMEDWTAIKADEHALFDQLALYRVTSMKVSGEGESEGVSISGSRKLKTGKALVLNSPFTKFTDEYQYMPELQAAVLRMKEEVELYLRGKAAPEPQKKIEFPAHQETAEGLPQ